MALVLLLLPLSHRHKNRPPCSCATLCMTRSEPLHIELCLMSSQLLKTRAQDTSTCWQSWMGSVNGHVCSGCCQAPACAGRAPSSSLAQRQGEASCHGGVLGNPGSAIPVGSCRLGPMADARQQLRPSTSPGLTSAGCVRSHHLGWGGGKHCIAG